MRKISWKSFVVFSIIFCASLLAADFWEKKAFTDWSEQECMKLLTKSPWGYQNGFRGAPSIGSLSWDNTVQEIYSFTFITAKPARMALGQLQLRQRPNDDSLKSEIQAYIDKINEEHILIQMNYKTIPAGTGNLQEVYSFFARANTLMFQSNTVLASGDEIFVPLLEYLPSSPTRPDPIFVFSRLNADGVPFFTGKEKSISFSCEFRMDGRPMKFFFRMKPKDMWFNGNFEM